MIRKKNISIRSIEERDLKVIYEWNSQEMRGLYQEFHFESFHQLQNDYKKDGFCSSKFQMLMIEDEDISIGLLYLNFYREGIVRVGLVLNPENCNEGNGTTILKLTIDFLFENYPIVRVEAETDIQNNAAQKVLENGGFLKEGTLRKYRFHHGTYNDSYMYSIVK